jgi:predicted kinase
MAYMTGEFLKAGISVIFDTNAMRLSQRRALRNMALKAGSHPLLLWLQVDPDSAFKRSSRRDRRKQDDTYAQEMEPATFRELLGGMQNPEITENYLVLSGKHVFNTQKNAVLRHLVEKRLIDMESSAHQLSKPGLINIVPNPAAGRVDMSRRNINIQ